jgi:hypothetical protein
MKKDKRKTTIYKTYTLKTRGELGCYGIVAVLAPLVVPVVLNSLYFLSFIDLWLLITPMYLQTFLVCFRCTFVNTPYYKTYTLKTRGELGCYGIVAVLAPLVVPVVLN